MDPEKIIFGIPTVKLVHLLHILVSLHVCSPMEGRCGKKAAYPVGWLPKLLAQALFLAKTAPPTESGLVSVCGCVCVRATRRSGTVRTGDLTQCNFLFGALGVNVIRLEACQGCGVMDWTLRICSVNLAFVICLTLICCISPLVTIEAGSDRCLSTSCSTAGEQKGHQEVLVQPLHYTMQAWEVTPGASVALPRVALSDAYPLGEPKW